MKEKYHRQITTEALTPYLDASVLETIIAANLGQDALRYQFGHDHFHYDSNSFRQGDAYVEELRRSAVLAIQQSDSSEAHNFFGRLTHTVQDLYAHSNYVFLWRARFPDASAGQIDPEVSEILQDSHLHSGKLYYPLEVFSFIPWLKPLVLPLLPRDSHAWMNLDAPDREGFDLAFAAAVKRTQAEFLRIEEQLTLQQANLFKGK